MAAEPSESHGADAAHTATTEAEHGSGGLPQFEFEHWGGQIAYLLLLFAILYVLVARVFAPRLRGVIDERAATIAKAIDTARQVQAEALDQARTAEAELADARARSQRVASDARSRAKAEAAERQAAEDAKLADRLGEAETRIQATRDAAMANVGAVASEITAAIVGKLTGAAATAAEVKSAIASREGAR